MIDGNLAITLNIFAVTVLSFVIANIAMSTLFILFSEKLLSLQLSSRKNLLWLIVSSPWLVGSSAAIYFLYDCLFSTPLDEVNDLTHWHHMQTFSLTSWHSVTIAIACLLLLNTLIKQFKKLRKYQQDIALLTALSSAETENFKVLASQDTYAFTCGFRQPDCFISEGLLNATSPQEQAVIKAHELAHADNFDPFKKWLFSLFAAFYLPSIAARLKLLMTLAMEQSADNSVREQDIEPTFIAQTLIKVARLNASANSTKQHIAPDSSELLLNFGADVLEQRIYFLLDKLTLKPINKAYALLFSLLLIGLCLTSVDSIHHLIEILFSH